MRDTFHAELHELMASLARLARLAGQMMTNASIALHQTDLPLAGLVIANRDHMGTMLDNTERRCITLLARRPQSRGTYGWWSRRCTQCVTCSGWATSPGTSPSLPNSSTPTRSSRVRS